jgi:hypothetical protein
MTIQEAIRSGKRFRRPKTGWWCESLSEGAFCALMLTTQHGPLSLKVSDILADDWEIEREPREWTVHLHLSYIGNNTLYVCSLKQCANHLFETIRVREVLP